MTQPLDTFDFTSKADVLPSALKGCVMTVGGLLVFNYLVDKPIVGDVLVNYRKAMHKFFKTIGGPKFNDPQMLDAGAMSAIDFISLSAFAVLGTRLGLSKQLKENSAEVG